MKWNVVIAAVVLANVLNAGSAAAQVIDLGNSGPSGAAIQWQGPQTNARAGASLLRADMSGDVDRVDLIAGAPGAGPHAEGQVYVLFMGPTYTSGSIAAAASAIVTGAVTGDEFGASTAAGMIIRREVAPLPPRDLVVGAPGAFSGQGAVYLFPGQFRLGDRKDASGAAFRIIGAPGDHLGSNIIAADIDGDGYRDIIMSAASTGRIYVIFGGPSLSGTRDLSAGPADLVITVPTGTVAMTFGDFNNDGFKDLVVGVPTAASGAGVAYLIKGKTRGAFPATLPIASADAQFTGIDPGDAAGTSLQGVDFDGDGVIDLLVGAPGAAGPSNGRAGAGEAYVFFGSSRFASSANLAPPDVTIYGANAGDHLAAFVSAGHIRRDQPDDLMFLAPGASSAGDIDVVYGNTSRAVLGSTIDLASGIDRVLRGDGTRAPLQSMVPMQVTGKGEDIVAASPAALGFMYVALSPTLSLDPATTAITVAQGATGTATVHIRNAGNLTAGWAARPNTSWLAMNPANGSTTAQTSGDLTLTITPGNLAPGTYHGGFTYLSNSRDLVWSDTGSVDLTVVAGSGTGTQPINAFGMPSDPDEGSPTGVNTPTGSNVTVVPLRDFLVRFTNVTQAGGTIVDVQPSSGGQAGVRPTPWIYTVRTTAVFSGPVTVGNAYTADFTTFEDDMRVLSGVQDFTTTVDKSLHAVYGSTSFLPSTFSIAEDRRRLIRLTTGGNGTGRGSIQTSVAPVNAPGCGENCFAFVAGARVTLTAVPASGTSFAGWGGVCTGNAMTCTVTLPSDRVVTSLSWTLNGPVPSGGGGGGPSPGPAPAPAPDPGPPPDPPGSPFAPGAFKSLVSGSTVMLTWAAPAAGPKPTNYIIEAGSAPGLDNLAVVKTADAGLVFVASGVGNGIYYVQIRAASPSGWGPPSKGIVVVVGDYGGGVPTAPINLTSTVVGSTVTLRWTATSPAAAYVIEAGSVPGLKNLANFSTGNSSTEFTAGGVGAGVYYVRVRAATPAGVSGTSNEIVVVVR